MIRQWLLRLFLGFLGFLALMASVSAQTAEAWVGELQVLSEAGPGCSPDPSAPDRLRLFVAEVHHGAGDEHPRYVAWGDIQAVVLVVDGGRQQAHGRPLSPSASWQVLVSTSPRPGADLWVGNWHETGSADPQACLFQTARFTLTAVPSGDEADGLVTRGQQMADLHDQLTPVLRALDAEAWRSAAARLLATASNEGWLPANRELATLLLEGARRGWAFRERASALALASKSVEILKGMGPTEAVFAARAIRRQAAMLRRVAGPEAAQEKLDEAVAWLDRYGLAESADMAALLSTQGAWWMRSQQWGKAQKSFEKASRIESTRKASPGELALALHNWAASLEKGGKPQEAQALWLQAKELVAGSSEPADRDLLSLIEESMRREAHLVRSISFG